MFYKCIFLLTKLWNATVLVIEMSTWINNRQIYSMTMKLFETKLKSYQSILSSFILNIFFSFFFKIDSLLLNIT